MKVLSALFVVLFSLALCEGQTKPVIASIHAERDHALTTYPNSALWRNANPIYADVDENGHVLPELRTEIRSRWTTGNIYFLFVCPYKQLYLKPQPDAEHETYELWNWNVAEVFIGSDFKDIQRYKEFEVSPHNEWIDLDINLHEPHHEKGWVWNSGFEHATRIDEKKHIWYAAMRIPFAALDSRPIAAGSSFRVNFFRTDGAEKSSKEVTWQPVMSTTFHVPERFGLLKLESK